MKHILYVLLLAAVCYGQTAQFPGAIADDQQLAVAKDSARSTLTSGVDDSTLTWPVANGAVFAEKQIVGAGTEQVQICTIAGNTLTLCSGSRGFNGTIAAVHPSGTWVVGIISSWTHNATRKEVQAIETALGVNLAHPLNKGTTLPATCTTGDTFFKTDAAAGENLYGCTTTNTWTLQSGGGSSTALTQATEFSVQGALVKSAAASGRAVEQSTCWRINPSTLALENTCAGATTITGQWQTGTLAEPSAGYTNLGFKLSTGIPVYRVNGGAEKTVAATDGNVATATALAANGSNCSAGNYPLGVDASGNVEDCTSAGGGGLPTQTGNAGAVLTTNGTDASWAHGIDKTKWIAQMRDNFVSGSTGAGLGWNTGGTTGAGADYLAHAFAHPGVLGRYVVYADAEKHAFIRLETDTGDPKGSVGAIGSNGKWDSYFTFRTDTSQTTQLAYRVGFIASAQVSASPPTDGIWLRYHNSSACSAGSNVTDSYWTYETRASSTSTTSATAVAYATQQWLTVRIRSLVAGTIKFSISTDDGATFSSETDISTNIPTGATLTPTFQVWGCAASTYVKIWADEFTYEAWR